MSEVKEFTPEEVEQFRGLVSTLEGYKAEREKLLTKDDGTALVKEQIKRVTSDILDVVDPQTKRIDAVEAALQRVGTPEEKSDPKAEYKDAFEAGLRHIARDGFAHTAPTEEQKKLLMEKKALSIDVDTSAGYLVPEDYRAELIDQAATEIDSLRPYTTAYATARDAVQWPTITAHAAASGTAEQGTVTADTTLTTGLVDIPLFKQTVMYDVSHELVQDSAFDVAGLLRAEFSQAFAYLEGTWFVNGSGSQQPAGFIGNSTITTNYVACGTAATLAGSDMKWVPKVQTKIKTNYWANAIWAMNRTTYGELLGLADGETRSYLQMDPTRANPMVLAGRPIVILPTMPAPTTGLFAIAYGDFRQGVKIIDKVPMAMQVDPYSQWASGNVRYQALRRVGFAVVKAEAFATVKIATS